jgi:hypothetical protein
MRLVKHANVVSIPALQHHKAQLMPDSVIDRVRQPEVVHRAEHGQYNLAVVLFDKGTACARFENWTGICSQLAERLHEARLHARNEWVSIG